MSDEGEVPQDFVGYYSAAWLWPEDQIDWVKTVLPFFDKISLILPADLLPSVLDRDPVLAQPLYDMGILENREPVEVLDRSASDAIVDAVIREVHRGRFDPRLGEALIGPTKMPFLTSEHFGHGYRVDDALRLLNSRGLAGSVGKDGLFRLNSDIQMFVLAVCAQTMCMIDRQAGRDASPFRPYGDRTSRLGHRYSRYLMQDIETVGTDLSALPLDEVLSLRQQHGESYRAYMRNLRKFSELPSYSSDVEEARAVRARREEIHDAASQLRKYTRISDLKTYAGIGIGIVSATWTARTGDYIGEAIGAASSALGLIPTPGPSSAYAYLFEVAKAGR
jgi:hypothetical protein